jgi:hypothetical protein
MQALSISLAEDDSFAMTCRNICVFSNACRLFILFIKKAVAILKAI